MLDTLIFGTNSEHVQSKLIQRDETLSLDEAIYIARTAEATKQQLQTLRAESNIHAMSNRRPQATHKPWHNAANYGTTHDGRSTQNQSYSSKPQQCDSAHCDHCGRQCWRIYTNAIEDCLAYGSTCRGCGKANHWIKMCTTSTRDTRTRRPTRPVMSKKHALENSKDTDNQSELYFDQLEITTLGTAGNTDGTQALVQLKCQSPQCTNQLICKLDTGAEGNVIQLTTYKTMSPRCNVTQYGIPTILHPSSMRITAYGGHTVTHCGTCKLQVTHRNESVMSTFHVVK